VDLLLEPLERGGFFDQVSRGSRGLGGGVAQLLLELLLGLLQPLVVLVQRQGLQVLQLVELAQLCELLAERQTVRRAAGRPRAGRRALPERLREPGPRSCGAARARRALRGLEEVLGALAALEAVDALEARLAALQTGFRRRELAAEVDEGRGRRRDFPGFADVDVGGLDVRPRERRRQEGRDWAGGARADHDLEWGGWRLAGENAL
jgi:hypothetical protein